MCMGSSSRQVRRPDNFVDAGTRATWQPRIRSRAGACCSEEHNQVDASRQRAALPVCCVLPQRWEKTYLRRVLFELDHVQHRGSRTVSKPRRLSSARILAPREHSVQESSYALPSAHKAEPPARSDRHADAAELNLPDLLFGKCGGARCGPIGCR